MPKNTRKKLKHKNARSANFPNFVYLPTIGAEIPISPPHLSLISCTRDNRLVNLVHHFQSPRAAKTPSNHATGFA